MKNLFAAILLSGLFTACSTGHNYYLETTDAEGLEQGAIVYRQGVKIGEVTDIQFVDREVRIGIETDAPLFEGQDFSFQNGPDGKPSVEFDRPLSDAEELADGEVIVDDNSFDISLGGALNETFIEAFGADGEKLEAKMEEVFGKDGEKLEAKFKELFGEDGEKLEASIENIIGKDGEKLKSALEDVLGEDGSKLQESIEMIIGKDGEKLEAWAEEFGGEFKELGDKIKAVDRRYEKDSPEYKREIRKVLEEWAEPGQ